MIHGSGTKQARWAALVRSVNWGDERNSAPEIACPLAVLPGSLWVCAYLVPQWVGAPGVLTPAATWSIATDKIQFVSAVLVAIGAGVGFDTVFRPLEEAG
jgi:hypothetical protein